MDSKNVILSMLLGFSIALITGNSNLVWLPAIFIWLDFTVSLIKEKWDNFNKEQEQMLKDISQEKQ